MPETTLNKPATDTQHQLTHAFTITAIIAVAVSVTVITTLTYYLLRSQGLRAELATVVYELDRDLVGRVNFIEFKAPNASQSARWKMIHARHGVTELSFFAPDKALLWSSQATVALSQSENSVFTEIVAKQRLSPEIIDPLPASASAWREIATNIYQPISVISPISDDGGNLIAVTRIRHDFNSVLRHARSATEKIFLLILIGHLLLVYLLHSKFRRSMLTINAQERKMQKQIARLSELLGLNKQLQQNMKSASSRAVELNEQFLRRVGADLHDGPAQSIGYAVLRLDQVSRSQQSAELGQEFHAVKEALDGALTEIRGISTGLVLPELDQLTLEQSLQRVVSRHAANSNIDVKQYYQNLPDDVGMPIKICAYRFVQEGLNNASRHGQAEKCRVSAHVKDNYLHLSLKDNGMGFRKSKLNTEGGHLGLMGLKDRIESLGGEFKINSELGVGTAIKVTIALSDDE